MAPVLKHSGGENPAGLPNTSATSPQVFAGIMILVAAASV
jgi:hypothetical protein